MVIQRVKGTSGWGSEKGGWRGGVGVVGVGVGQMPLGWRGILPVLNTAFARYQVVCGVCV